MKIKKRCFIFVIIIILLIISVFLINKYRNKDPYEFKGNTLYYSENRGKTDYEILSKSSNESINIYKIKFKSKNFLDNPTIIYGLLFIPKDKKNVPGLVLLPGGGGTKEQESRLASKIAKLGYGVLTIDQRGIGETGGVYLGIEQDYQVFTQGKEPIQHLSVYDALKTYDVLREFKEEDGTKMIDREKIGFVGESMGARYAIITAAIEKRTKGVIAVSTSGFHIELSPLQTGNDYLVSIDPDHYINKIAPNFVMMLHGTNDTVVPLKDAQITFSKAKEPKRFFVAENCQHGYCEKMWEELKKGLEIMFEKES